MDWSSPGSSVHGILQGRTLEWAAISFCRGSSRPRDRTRVSYVSCIGKHVLSATCEACGRNTSLIHGKMSTLTFPLLLVRSKVLKPSVFSVTSDHAVYSHQNYFKDYTQRQKKKKKFKEPRPVFLVCEDNSFWVLNPS